MSRCWDGNCTGGLLLVLAWVWAVCSRSSSADRRGQADQVAGELAPSTHAHGVLFLSFFLFGELGVRPDRMRLSGGRRAMTATMLGQPCVTPLLIAPAPSR